MPLPSRNDDESAKDFMPRCMSSDKMKEEYPDNKQRYAVANEMWRKRFSRYIK